MNLLAITICLVALTDAAVNDDEAEFHNDRQLIEEETGGTLRLQSHGKLAKIVDLDETPCVKRVLCRGDKVLVALKNNAPAFKWQPDQVVISKQWQCNSKINAPDSYTIYAMVEAVKQPKEYYVELDTRGAGPLDMLEEASVKIHYEQGTKPSKRQKRFISEALNAIDWNTSFVSDIVFNEIESKARRSINVYKLKGAADLNTDTDNEVEFTNDTHFLFRCPACHGHSQVSYHFELRVKKVDKKPQVLKYMMQLEVDTTIEQRFDMDIADEVSLTKLDMLWKEEPTTIFETKLIEFPKLEPVILRVIYTGQANIELTSKTRNKTQCNVDFTARGNTVITQIFEEGQPTINEVTSYNWTVVSNEEDVDVFRNMNTTFAVFQNMTIAPMISWAQKDVDFNLGPPIQISIRPRINVVSTSDGTSRCASSSVTIHSNVTVAETDFSVDAFGFQNFHNWSVVLMEKLLERKEVLRQPLMEKCWADCRGLVIADDNRTMEEACGYPTERIVRRDPNFQRLHQLWGDYILFASEEAKSSSWCGVPDRPCVSCLTDIVGDSDTDKCADRMVNSDLAASLTRLAKLVEAEWGNRKVLVTEAWDEPTSEFPEGRHGNISVFYEGRGASVALTKPNPDTSSLENIETEPDNDIFNRFHELAVCSNFQKVTREVNMGVVRACVAKKSTTHVKKRAILSRTRRSGDVHHPSVKSILESVGSALEAVKSEVTPPEELTEGMSYPPDISMEEACGDVSGVVSQDNVERMKRLVEYPLTNILFSAEGPSDTWCGVETRRCRNCTLPVEDDDVTDTWSWCGTRTMSMRLATRLQRLAVLTDGNIAVTRAHTTNLTSGISRLYEEGRAATIEIPHFSSMTMSALTAWAKFAGFDYVSFSSPNAIEVCVKPQDGLEAQIVLFPLSTLTAVPLPLDDEYEFAYPPTHAHEIRKPLLFDKTTMVNELSEHFKMHMFLSPGVKYVRLDTELVNLLELAYDDFPGGFYILPGSAYRPRSVTLDNVDGRHEKERYRFQMGQAVEIKPSGLVNDDTLFDLGISLIKAGRTVQEQRLGIGIGAKKDRLYFHIRPLMHNETHTEVWDSGNPLLYEKFRKILDQLTKGGFIITAKSNPEICATPALGEEYFYFNFDLDEEGYCPATPEQETFCSETLEHRKTQSEQFLVSLITSAGSNRLMRSDIEADIQKCVVNLCGGCAEQGSIWNEKVLACTRMILKYLSRASVPFQPLRDKVAVFNTENTKSTVYAEACDNSRICVENTQIYGILKPLLTAKYYHEKSPEELFGAADNPSPLLEIAEQELAWRAEGKVDVFIDGTRDITALRNVLKILMLYNKNVTEVIFHIDPDLNQIAVTSTLQRKLEEWSSSVCPQWSRVAVTPYTVQIISHERKKRSVEKSQGRNKKKHELKHWEVDWVMKS